MTLNFHGRALQNGKAEIPTSVPKPAINTMSAFTAEKGTLYLVATPIGNLGDITLRALEILKSVDRIACEDTRVTAKLLQHFEIQKPLAVYQEHNEKTQSSRLVELLKSGESIALVTDAGTPCISDPGFRVVRACRLEGIPVVPVVGASAIIGALSASGLPTNGFLFLGFLPPRSATRIKTLETYRNFPYTLIFYESCHRILKFLEEIVQTYGSTRACACAREITKQHETFNVGTTIEVLEAVRQQSQKGEFVVMIAPEDFQL